MTVTIDLNVLLDVFERRQPHFAEGQFAATDVADIGGDDHIRSALSVQRYFATSRKAG